MGGAASTLERRDGAAKAYAPSLLFSKGMRPATGESISMEIQHGMDGWMNGHGLTMDASH